MNEKIVLGMFPPFVVNAAIGAAPAHIIIQYLLESPLRPQSLDERVCDATAAPPASRPAAPAPATRGKARGRGTRLTRRAASRRGFPKDRRAVGARATP